MISANLQLEFSANYRSASMLKSVCGCSKGRTPEDDGCIRSSMEHDMFEMLKHPSDVSQ